VITRYLVCAAAALSAMPLAAATLSTSVDCFLTTPGGPETLNESDNTIGWPNPSINSTSRCRLAVPGPSAIDGLIGGHAEATISVGPESDPVNFGNNQLNWFANTIGNNPTGGFSGEASASAELLGWFLTPGPRRPGILEFSYNIRGDAVFSFGDFSCSSCNSGGGFTTMPFELGVPFRIYGAASSAVSFNQTVATNQQFGPGGYVVFRPREVSGDGTPGAIVAVLPTPEPGTVGMILLGVGVLGLGRRFRGQGSASRAVTHRIEIGKRPPCA